MVLSRNRTFFFLVWFHIKKKMVVSRIFLHENLKPWVVSWSAKIKNIETHLVPRLGPRTGAEVRGPSLGTNMGFNFLIFRTSWIPPKVFKFLCKICVNTTKNFKNNLWNPDQKIKKIRAVYIEIRLWWYFGQKYSVPNAFFDYWHYYLTITVV